MPEGDTIYRLARTLDRALAGQVVTSFESVYPALTRIDEDAPIVGRTVTRVRSAGKHLLIELSPDLVLHTHLRMNGRWHLVRRGDERRRPPAATRILIGTRDWSAFALNVQVAEFLHARALARHEKLSALGPDLLDPGFDEPEAAARLRGHGETEVADAILDQRVMAGIGNVFKSEVLFVAGVSPFRKAAALSEAEVSALIAAARRLLSMNVREDAGRMPPLGGPWRRTTRYAHPAARLWVYGRAGRPCRRCGGSIRAGKQGPDARFTFWCPACQR